MLGSRRCETSAGGDSGRSRKEHCSGARRRRANPPEKRERRREGRLNQVEEEVRLSLFSVRTALTRFSGL